jgi:uncharacterized protein YybS (DUF2232 family)
MSYIFLDYPGVLIVTGVLYELVSLVVVELCLRKSTMQIYWYERLIMLVLAPALMPLLVADAILDRITTKDDTFIPVSVETSVIYLVLIFYAATVLFTQPHIEKPAAQAQTCMKE